MKPLGAWLSRLLRRRQSRDESSRLLLEGGWTCDGCGKTRPDSLIAVASDSKMESGGIKASLNLRYCTDRPECLDDVNAQLTKWVRGE